MFRRALLGATLGGGVGGLYGAFGRCVGGTCHLDWNAAVPTFAGAALGLFLVLGSRWD